MSTQPFDTLEHLRNAEWNSTYGLLIYSIGIFTIDAALIAILKTIEIPLNLLIVLLILFIPVVINLISWVIKRYFTFGKNVPTIVFAIETENIARQYYLQIIKSIQTRIISLNLENEINIIKLASDQLFHSKQQAESFIINRNFGMIFWGNATQAEKEGKEFTRFNIFYSYQHSPLTATQKSNLMKDINLGGQRALWGVSKPDSHINLIIVSGNIVEISLFVLGLCLCTIPNLNLTLTSVKLLEELLSLLAQRNEDENFPNLRLVKSKTKQILLQLYIKLVKYYWFEQEDLNNSFMFTEKILSFDDNNFFGHQNIALFYWYKGDKDKARYHTRRAYKIYPGNDITRLNNAFFDFYDGKYEQGLRQYKKVKSTIGTNILKVLEFLEYTYKKENNKHGLLFALGWLNYYFVDQDIGREQLKDFISKTKTLSEYTALRKYANSLN